MSTAAGILVGLFLILLGVGYLGAAIPPLILGVVALLAGVLVIVAGLPWKVAQ